MAKTRVPIHGTTPPKSVLIDPAATNGAQIGVNLLLPDGSLAKMSDFGATSSTGGDSIDTTDDLDEGAYHFYFTDLRAQDAVGTILADSATIDLAYVSGTSITATLKDLADSGAGAALVKLTRDAKGRISGTESATTTDLTEGSNLYFTDERAQAAVVVSGITDGDTDHSPSGDAVFEALAGKEPAITAGTIAQYRRGDKTWRDFATDVRGAVLTGLSTATSAAIAATDTVLQAFGKLQAQVSAKAADAKVTAIASISVSQALTNATTTKVLLDTKSVDTGSYFDTTTSKFTPLVAGTYLVVCSAAFSFAGPGTAGERIIVLVYKNGAQFQAVTAATHASSSNAIQVTSLVPMNGTTDYIEMYARRDTTTAYVLTAGTTTFSALRISA